jgi:hypothetical protein
MLKWQVGQFLVFMGLIGLLVFFITDQVNAPDYLFFCSGLLVLILGGYVMWVGRNPAPPSERFRFLRRMSENRERKKKKEKEKK